MPVLGTMGAMSARGFGALASLGGGYWIGTLGGASTDIARAIALDQFGNVFIGGTAEISGATDFEIAKYNTFGAIEWQRRLGGTNLQNLYGLLVMYMLAATTEQLMTFK